MKVQENMEMSFSCVGEASMNADSLYYIMDYGSNYYRVDKADQLVVAANKGEATVFTFAQANRRICVGRKASFYCMIPI